MATNRTHELIHSLDPNEKRYFVLYAQRYKKDTNYAVLFDAFCQMENYDDKLLKEKMSGESFIEHLQTAKSQLRIIVLDCLHEYYSSKSVSENVKKQIHQAEILARKSSPRDAVRMLEKAKKTALANDYYFHVLMANKALKDILTQYPPVMDFDKIDELFEQEKIYLDMVQNTNRYWHLLTKVYAFHQKFLLTRDEEEYNQLQELFDSKWMQDDSLPMGFSSKMYFHQIKSLFYFMSGMGKEASVQNKKIIDLFEANPDKMNLYSNNYITTYGNYLADCLQQGLYEDALEGVKKYRKLGKKFSNKRNNYDLRTFVFSYKLEFNTYINQGDFENAIKAVKNFEKQLNIFKDDINQGDLMLLNYQIALIHYYNGQYKKANESLFDFNQVEQKGTFEHLAAFNRIFSLILEYELTDDKLIDDGLIESAINYLKYRKHYKTFERCFFKHFKKVANCMSSKTRIKYFDALKKDLESLDQDNQFFASQYFNFYEWIDRQIENA